MASRRERLEALLREQPDDAFLQYGLSIEQADAGQVDEALRGFRALMDREPPYVAAFFRAGQLLVSEGRVEESRDILRTGIEVARKQGDAHAAGEMSEFLVRLGDLAGP